MVFRGLPRASWKFFSLDTQKLMLRLYSVDGRVLRRRAFSSNVIFLDMMVTAIDGAPTPGPAVLACCVSCAPDVAKQGSPYPRAAFYADKEVFARAKDGVRPGDAIRLRGAFEAEAAECQVQEAGSVGNRHTHSQKVLSTVIWHAEFTRALTFENLCQIWRLD